MGPTPDAWLLLALAAAAALAPVAAWGRRFRPPTPP